MAALKFPCDEGVVRSKGATAPCAPSSGPPDARKLDIPGAVLATVGLGGVVFGLIDAQSSGFGCDKPAGRKFSALGIALHNPRLAGIQFVHTSRPFCFHPLRARSSSVSRVGCLGPSLCLGRSGGFWGVRLTLLF